jgi:hypothetical protein
MRDPRFLDLTLFAGEWSFYMTLNKFQKITMNSDEWRGTGREEVVGSLEDSGTVM